MEFSNSSLVTCFACGSSLPLLFARQVRVTPPTQHNEKHNSLPFFPELLGKECPPGALVKKDGTSFLCPFCLILLEVHFRGFRKRRGTCCSSSSTSYTSFYAYGTIKEEWKRVLSHFKCTVCAVETYRKRVRLLPVQRFRFLEKRINPTSPLETVILEDDLRCAIVCLDCSETLWIQNDEYDRLKAPIFMRMFNWFARPPPPEISCEAGLARLPSGKIKYPRRTLMETLCIRRVIQTVEVTMRGWMRSPVPFPPSCGDPGCRKCRKRISHYETESNDYTTSHQDKSLTCLSLPRHQTMESDYHQDHQETSGFLDAGKVLESMSMSVSSDNSLRVFSKTREETQYKVL